MKVLRVYLFNLERVTRDICSRGKLRQITKRNKTNQTNLLTNRIQWQYPELAHSKVIDFSRETPTSCFVVSRVGPVENDETHEWYMKVTNRAGEQMYKGVCVPSAELIIRPGSIVDLVYTAVSSSS